MSNSPVKELDISPFPHQRAFLLAPEKHPLIEFFFLIAGYNAGKTFTMVLTMLYLAKKYDGEYIRIGVGGGTMTLLHKTLLSELFKVCAQADITYRWNAQDHVLIIGTVEFVILATERPEIIYGYNFNAFLCDELDELTHEKAMAAFMAINERTRISFPDGRQPYVMFATTAQGYKGTYAVFNLVKERGEPYWILHAKSEDNKAISPRWLTRMKSIYNEIERAVFLEGKFANLTTGRVYYAYDEEKHRLAQRPFEVEPNDLIRIGQDFNPGYSRGSAVVKRNGVLYVTTTWSFGEIGSAPRGIRTKYPPNVIEWYPDATSVEVVNGYLKEVREHHLQCRVGTINPSVIDRIYFINKLFELGKLFLFPGPETSDLSMALKVRQFDDKGNPEKGKGPTAPDHYCDGLEYVIWRIVSRDREFLDLWDSLRHGRKVITDKLVA